MPLWCVVPTLADGCGSEGGGGVQSGAQGAPRSAQRGANNPFGDCPAEQEAGGGLHRKEGRDPEGESVVRNSLMGCPPPPPGQDTPAPHPSPPARRLVAPPPSRTCSDANPQPSLPCSWRRPSRLHRAELLSSRSASKPLSRRTMP